jgi:dTDP-glucose pyrophosphorylase
MLNIVVPMAGHGTRFANAGFQLPKPLIQVHDVPMIRLVIENIRPRSPHRFVFVVLREHLERFPLERSLREWAGDVQIVALDGVTEGAACSVLTAREFIDSAEPLMIANSDQYVDVRIDDYLAAMDRAHDDGFIMTMWADHPKWSFVRLDAEGRVCEVVEKQVVSSEATVGIYNFRRGADFVLGADEMIAEGRRVAGEFYVAPVYNQLLRRGMRVGYYNVGSVHAGMHGLGTPEDLEIFLGLPQSRSTSRQS